MSRFRNLNGSTRKRTSGPVRTTGRVPKQMFRRRPRPPFESSDFSDPFDPGPTQERTLAPTCNSGLQLKRPSPFPLLKSPCRFKPTAWSTVQSQADSWPVPLAGLQHCLANHFLWWRADLHRSRIQTATQRESLCFLRPASNILSIDSDGRRTTKSELTSHSFVSDEHLTDLRGYTLCGQDVSD